MFKMNPHAKEFIPAHILRKRKEQEEADRLANDIGKVNINNENGKEDKDEPTEKTSNNSNNKTPDTQTQSDHLKTTTEETTSSVNQKKVSTTKNDNLNSGDDFNQNQPDDYYYPDEDEYGDDEVYLANGENICEFNGEQFIIPNDDDVYEPPRNVAYDFGNDEDNEDEEVRKAFEEFLGDLPQ